MVREKTGLPSPWLDPTATVTRNGCADQGEEKPDYGVSSIASRAVVEHRTIIIAGRCVGSRLSPLEFLDLSGLPLHLGD